MGQVIEANDETFADAVKTVSGRIVVNFSADWCGPCRMIDPMLNDMAAKSPNLTVIKINADQSPLLVGRFGVRSIPSLYIVQDGKMSGAFKGPRNADNIARWAQNAVATKPIPDQAQPRAVAEADPEQKEVRLSLRKPYFVYNLLQAGAGYMLLSAAVTPLMTGVAAAIIGYSALRITQNLLTSPESTKRRLNTLLDKLGENPHRRWLLLPRYAQATTRLLGNAAVLGGGVTLFGTAMVAPGLMAVGLTLLSSLMVVKGGFGMFAGLAGMATTSALPRVAVIRAQKKGLSADADDNVKANVQLSPSMQPGIGPDVRLDAAVTAVAEFSGAVRGKTLTPLIPRLPPQDWAPRP